MLELTLIYLVGAIACFVFSFEASYRSETFKPVKKQAILIGLSLFSWIGLAVCLLITLVVDNLKTNK
jgi:hypothetical protein